MWWPEDPRGSAGLEPSGGSPGRGLGGMLQTPVSRHLEKGLREACGCLDQTRPGWRVGRGQSSTGVEQPGWEAGALLAVGGCAAIT